jgi:hypothetical protein
VRRSLPRHPQGAQPALSQVQSRPRPPQARPPPAAGGHRLSGGRAQR